MSSVKKLGVPDLFFYTNWCISFIQIIKGDTLPGTLKKSVLFALIYSYTIRKYNAEV